MVPEGDVNYSKDVWGMNLGVLVNTIRNKDAYLKYKERLTALGFVYESVFDVQFAVIYSAFEAYKAVHGNLLVPKKFIVPEGDVNYSKDVWGMNLGSIVSYIRNNDVYLKYKGRLTALGFVYESVFDVQFDVIYSALEAYKVVHGNLFVPHNFVVPQGDVNYPVETWGMKLGINVNSIRNQGTYSDHRAKLEELGFVYESASDVQFDGIFSAFKAYKAIHGNLLVPQKFVVPEGDARFPVETWGMKLGFNVANIRNRGDYSEHRAKLEELGFVYKKNKKIVEID
jgi:Fe2+ transport system protein FeoA